MNLSIPVHVTKLKEVEDILIELSVCYQLHELDTEYVLINILSENKKNQENGKIQKKTKKSRSKDL